MRIQVDRGYGRTPPRQFDRIKSCIATYIQHFPSVQLLRDFFFDLIPFESGKVSEEMIGCGLITCGQMDIMKPGCQFFYMIRDRRSEERRVGKEYRSRREESHR